MFLPGNRPHPCDYRSEPEIVHDLLHLRDLLRDEAQTLRKSSPVVGPDFRFEFQLLGDELAAQTDKLDEFIGRLRRTCLGAAAHALAEEARAKKAAEEE